MTCILIQSYGKSSKSITQTENYIARSILYSISSQCTVLFIQNVTFLKVVDNTRLGCVLANRRWPSESLSNWLQKKDLGKWVWTEQKSIDIIPSALVVLFLYSSFLLRGLNPRVYLTTGSLRKSLKNEGNGLLHSCCRNKYAWSFYLT